MLNIGVIGCGYWGAKHARVCRELTGCRLYSIVDYDLNKVKAINDSYPDVRAMLSVEEFLADPVLDAVIVATPASTHYNVAVKVLQAGKHVLVEKPMTVHTDQAKHLIRVAKQNDLTLMVGHTFEFNPAVEALREVVCSEELGSLYYMEFARLNLGLYQRDVNVVYDLSPHDISVMIYVLGERPTQVRARGYSMVHGGVIDVAYIEYGFASGLVANSRVSWLAPKKVREITVVGSHKMIVYDDAAGDDPLQIFEKRIAPPVETERFEDWQFAYHYGPITSVPFAKTEPLKKQTSHFVECILSKATPQTDGQNGLNVVTVLDAIQKSLTNNGAVEVITYEGSPARLEMSH